MAPDLVADEEVAERYKTHFTGLPMENDDAGTMTWCGSFLVKHGLLRDTSAPKACDHCLSDGGRQTGAASCVVPRDE